MITLTNRDISETIYNRITDSIQQMGKQETKVKYTLHNGLPPDNKLSQFTHTLALRQVFGESTLEWKFILVLLTWNLKMYNEVALNVQHNRFHY